MPLTQESLSGYNNGTNDYHHVGTVGRMKFYATDGVRHVMEEGGTVNEKGEASGAHWLTTAILSYQRTLQGHPDRRLREMQFWNLGVLTATRKAILTCRADSGENPAVMQIIEYTDFNLPTIDIWVEYGSLDGETPAYIIMLPSER